MHSYVMSPFWSKGERPWVWNPYHFDLIFEPVLAALREKQAQNPNDDRGACIEWLNYTMETRFYRFDLGDYAIETVVELRQAVVDNRETILNDQRLIGHKLRNALEPQLVQALEDLIEFIDNHLKHAREAQAH